MNTKTKRTLVMCMYACLIIIMGAIFWVFLDSVEKRSQGTHKVITRSDIYVVQNSSDIHIGNDWITIVKDGRKIHIPREQVIEIKFGKGQIE